MIFTVHEKEIFSGSSLGRLRGKGAEEENQTFSYCGCPFFLEAAVGGCQVRACRRWKRARSAEKRRVWHGGLGVEGGRGTFAWWPI